ncbi:AraC-type DNA-binding protein [Alkalispirochaeta americana]|uniref:AraC-type DNA-binding protein n=1 Tax=Alkalispirochaeta americana TaxID=159291 RepID=A0A1N6T713_9SPIO|nr:helix-turn-helix transcriptional regulator [Alkalispirochaeta americana]SIQ49119.1 AraC-type DNA-binding protein [Alkalispirochaeta americana]
MTHPATQPGLIAFSVVSLLGSTNCLIFGLLSWKTYRKHPRGTPHYNAAPWLLALFLALSAGFASAWYQDSLSYRIAPHLLPFTFSFRLLYGPLIFGFSWALLGHSTPSRFRTALHLTPFYVHLVLLVPLMGRSGGEKILFWEQTRWISQFYSMAIILQIVHLLVYMICTLAVIQRSTRPPLTVWNPTAGLRAPSSRREELSWLSNILVAVAVVLGIFTFMTGAFILGASPEIILFTRRMNEALLFVAIHLLAYQGIRYGTLLAPSETPQRRGLDRSQTEEASQADNTGGATAADAPQDSKEHFDLSDSAAQALARQADEHIRRTLAFLDPALSPGDLAQEMDVHPHNLSHAINNVLGQRFSHYMNGYRAEYARRLLISSSHGATPLTEIARMSGFRSKSCFNATFRSCYGCTPSEFRKKSAVSPGPSRSDHSSPSHE